jgi:Acetyltransferase (GNAT) domain
MRAHRLQYFWQNSGNPAVIRLHHWSDAISTIRQTAIESTVADGGVRIGYTGLADGRTHILPFLEQRRNGTALRRETSTSWRDVATGSALPECDILAVGGLAPRIAALPVARSLLLPLRISLIVPVGTVPATIRHRLSRKARQQYVRELGRSNWVLDIASGDAAFAFFYDRMHVPTMVRRHGLASRSVPRAAARTCIYQHGVLFFLTQGGQRVAGMLCRREGDVLIIRLAGVLDGDAAAYQRGEYLALYMAILEWAAGHEVRYVDLSGCEPFLSKGIFQFKRKMHPEVRLPRNHFQGKRLWLQVRRDTGAVRDFLVANPALTVTDGGTGLTAVYFHDSDRPPRTDLRWQSPGVSGCRYIDLDEFLCAERATTVTA